MGLDKKQNRLAGASGKPVLLSDKTFVVYPHTKPLHLPKAGVKW